MAPIGNVEPQMWQDHCQAGGLGGGGEEGTSKLEMREDGRCGEGKGLYWRARGEGKDGVGSVGGRI